MLPRPAPVGARARGVAAGALPRAAARAVVLALLLAPAAPTPAAAQDGPLPLARLTAPVTLDGRVDEPAWAAVAPLPLTTYLPVFRAPASQRTEIRVAYDADHLYVSARNHDADAGLIRVHSLYRDRWSGDDALAIYVDGFNDNRTSKWFGLTAGGVRFDQLISDDGATFNESWDGFWAARTVIADSGWSAEVRIPFATIGIQPDAAGDAVMGLTITRLVPRLNERVTFPAIEPRLDFRRPSAAQDVVARGVRAGRPVYATPYVLMGRARQVAAGPPDVVGRHDTREVGGDLRYAIASDLTLDLTVKTDFAQVEADDQQVNLDRFPLFFPERRRFFQEGSGTFDFVAGGGSRLFFSRRIGLEQGRPVPLLGGARLVGRAGGWDVGGLAIQSERTPLTPSENFAVLRGRRGILNPYSTAGFMVTSRAGAGAHNGGLGLDAVVRVLGDHFATAKVAATRDTRDTGTASLSERGLLDLAWERRVERGLQYRVAATRTGADFRPELGFLQRRDYSMVNAHANWYRLTDRHPFFRRVYPGALYVQTYRNATRELESAQYAVWIQWDTKAGGGGWLEPKWFREQVAEPFTIGAVTIPAGTYDFFDWQAVYATASTRRLRARFDARAGSFYDGRRRQLIVQPTWNLSSHLELGGDYQLTALRFPARGAAETIHVARLRVRGALDAHASANLFAQYNSTTDAVALNLRVRYNFSEGTDLWLVYDEALDLERYPEAFGRPFPFSRGRSLVLKYSHTFSL